MTVAKGVTRPLDPTDASWAGAESVRLLRGLVIPSEDRLQSAVERMIEQALPMCRLLDIDGLRWRQMRPSGLLTRRLISTSMETAEDVDALLARNEELGDLPFRVVVGEDWLKLQVSHAVFDGWSALAFCSSLLAAAADDSELTPSWTTHGVLHRDAVVGRYLLRHPGRLRRAWARRSALGSGSFIPRGDAPAAHVSTFRLGPIGGPSEIRRMRDAHWPGATVASVMLVGFRHALAAHVSDPRDGAEVLYDTRRIIPGTRDAFGNWTVGVYVNADRETTPAVLSVAMKSAVEQGLPVMAAAAPRVLQRLHGRGGERMVAAPTGRPRVALSFVGAHSRVAELPWIHGAPRVAASFGEPNGPDGVSLNVTEMADRHHVTVSYYAEQFPRGGVAAAVEGFLNDPASYLLDAAETTRV